MTEQQAAPDLTVVIPCRNARATLGAQLEALATQRTVFSVEDSVATTTSDRLTALIQLYKALGGGWDAQPAAIAGTSHS